MMRKTLVSLICATSLVSGCSLLAPREVVVPDDEANFCDVIRELRRFTQDELDARSAQWPTNLRKDFALNNAWQQFCGAASVAEVTDAAPPIS